MTLRTYSEDKLTDFYFDIDDPKVYIWDDFNYTGNSRAYSANVSSIVHDLTRKASPEVHAQLITHADLRYARSVIVPPNVEVKWSTMGTPPFNKRCSQNVGENSWQCPNQGTWAWDEFSRGFYPNLYKRSGNPLYDTRPIGMGDWREGTSNPWKDEGPGTNDLADHRFPNNTLKLIHIEVKKPWKRYKLDCCRGVGTEETCGPYWGPENPESCDTIMTNYCRDSPDDPDCACLLSQVANPQCYDPKCLGNHNAYRNSVQRKIFKAGCPNTIKCEQLINISEHSDSNIIDNALFKQACISKHGGAVDTKTGEWIPETDPRWVKNNVSTESGAQTVDTDLVIIFIGFIFIVIVTLMIINRVGRKPVITQERNYASV